MSDPTTPLMQQYQTIKSLYPHALLLFRLGDFYELFYEDAILASRELQITLTSRIAKGPAHPNVRRALSLRGRLHRTPHSFGLQSRHLRPDGAAGPGKKLVRREVVRVITPGTATDGALLEAKENSFLASVFQIRPQA